MILKNIFKKIKDKNDNCKYIYMKLTNHPKLFTPEINSSIYKEAIDIYERIKGEKKELAKARFEQSRKKIAQITLQESKESESIDDLLNYI